MWIIDLEQKYRLVSIYFNGTADLNFHIRKPKLLKLPKFKNTMNLLFKCGNQHDILPNIPSSILFPLFE